MSSGRSQAVLQNVLVMFGLARPSNLNEEWQATAWYWWIKKHMDEYEVMPYQDAMRAVARKIAQLRAMWPLLDESDRARLRPYLRRYFSWARKILNKRVIDAMLEL